MKMLPFIKTQLSYFKRLWRRGSSHTSPVLPERSVCYSLREIIEETTGSLALVARRNGVEMIVTVRDSVPDRFEGSAEGIQRAIRRQVDSALKGLNSGFLRFDVSCITRSDGAAKLRFRTSHSRKHKPYVGFLLSRFGRPFGM